MIIKTIITLPQDQCRTAGMIREQTIFSHHYHTSMATSSDPLTWVTFCHFMCYRTRDGRREPPAVEVLKTSKPFTRFNPFSTPTDRIPRHEVALLVQATSNLHTHMSLLFQRRFLSACTPKQARKPAKAKTPHRAREHPLLFAKQTVLAPACVLGSQTLGNIIRSLEAVWNHKRSDSLLLCFEIGHKAHP